MNEAVEALLIAEATNYRDRHRMDVLPEAYLPDWMWDKMPEGYAQDFKRRTGITLKRYEDQ